MGLLISEFLKKLRNLNW